MPGCAQCAHFPTRPPAVMCDARTGSKSHAAPARIIVQAALPQHLQHARPLGRAAPSSRGAAPNRAASPGPDRSGPP
eukprot:4241036-Prymnesium_polylepis.1